MRSLSSAVNIVWGQANFMTVEGVLSSFFVTTVTTVANGHVSCAHFKAHFQLREKVEKIRIWCPWLRRVDMKQSSSQLSFILKTVKCFLAWLIWGLNKNWIEKVFFFLLPCYQLWFEAVSVVRFLIDMVVKGTPKLGQNCVSARRAG